MSHADANRLGERLGSRTGVVVRTAKKYLLRTGIELVPRATVDKPHAFEVYYRGTDLGRLDGAAFPTSARLLAAVYNAVAWHLHTAAEEEE